MAKKYIIELETKADGTIGTLNEVAKGLEAVAAAEKKVSDNTEDVTAQLAKLKEQLLNTDVKSDQYKELTEQYKKLGGSIDELVPKTNNLKQEQRELKKALLAGQEALGVEKYTQLTQRLGEVNDQLKDIAESAGQNAGPPLENLSNISGGLTDRLKNLDFDGLSQDVRNFAGNIKNVSFSSITSGIKGLGTAFSSLGKALLSNPIFAIAAALIAIALAVKAFVDSEREDVQKLNEELDKGAAKRKDRERLAFAQAAGDTQKITQLKLASNAADLNDTQKKIDNLVNLQRSYVGITEEQEKELADLRDKFRSQEIDRELIKIEAINALNAKRLDIAAEFELRNLDDRAKSEALLTREFAKQSEELRKLGGTAEDFEKLDEVFATRFQNLRQGFADADKTASTAAASAAKTRRDSVIAEQKAANDAIAENQKTVTDLNDAARSQELSAVLAYYDKLIAAAKLAGEDVTKLEEDKIKAEKELSEIAKQNELDAVADKYTKLLEQARKAKVDTDQIITQQAKEEQLIRDKFAQEAIDKATENAAVKLEAAQAVTASVREATQGEEATELQALETKYKQELAILKAAGQSTVELTELYAKQRQGVVDKYSADDVEKEKERQQALTLVATAGLNSRQLSLATDLAALKVDYDARIALAKKFGQDSSAIEQEYADKIKQKRLDAAVETVARFAETASLAIDALGSLNEQKSVELATKLKDIDASIEGARTQQQRDELIKRRTVIEAEQKKIFEKNKRLQIAGAVVNTIASSVAAFGSQVIVGDPTSIVRGVIAAAGAAAAGAANIAKIKATQFESSTPPTSENVPAPGGGASAPGGGGSESSTPGFNPLVLDFLNNRPEQQTPRAYVLAGDVEKATQARDRVEELARL
jgi:hypothetical protein